MPAHVPAAGDLTDRHTTRCPGVHDPVSQQGNSSAAIARELAVTDAAVVKHIGNILAKLDLPPDDDTNRRVLAVLAFLRGAPAT